MEEQVEAGFDKASVELCDKRVSKDIGWLWQPQIVIIAWILLHIRQIHQAPSSIAWGRNKLQIRLEQLWQGNNDSQHRWVLHKF